MYNLNGVVVMATMRSELRGRLIFGYMLIAPAFILLLIFFVWPVILGIINSFYNKTGTEFVGLSNYLIILKDPRFWNSMKVSVIFTFSITIFSGILGLFFALAIGSRPRFYKLYLAIAFIPFITSPVVTSLVWLNLLSHPYGLINDLLYRMGFSTIAWFKSPHLALISLILIQIWNTFGYNAVLFLAGLQAIPKSYYEASIIDGCGFLGRLRHITLPLLIPTTIFVMMVSMLYGFINSYVLSSLITDNGPFEATNVILSYIFEYAFDRFDLPRANAITMFVFILFFSVSYIQFKYQRKRFSGVV